MIPSRTIVLSILTLWLVFLSIMQIPFIQSLVGDPPSLYNRGDGGLSELVSAMTIYRKIKVARSIDDVWSYEPGSSIMLVLGLDFFPKEYEVLQLLRWVERGGVLIVLDEFTTPRPLLEKLNLEIGTLVSDVSLGECYVNGFNRTILFNVYREVLGGEPICWVGNVPVAAEVRYGGGKVLVFGDSSIFINEILRSRYRQAHLSFALSLLNRDTVVFFEGGRLVTEALFSPKVLVAIPYYVGKFAQHVVLGDPATSVFRVVAAGLLALTLISPRSLEGLSKPSIRRRRKNTLPEVNKLFKESVEDWLSWVNKLGK
ncbi:MAG: DUF4350 domain-containing protein [Sulfolobales archaeon]